MVLELEGRVLQNADENVCRQAWEVYFFHMEGMHDGFHEWAGHQKWESLLGSRNGARKVVTVLERCVMQRGCANVCRWSWDVFLYVGE